MGAVYNPPQEQIQFLQDYDLQYVDLNLGSDEFAEGEIVGEDQNGNALKLSVGTTITHPKICHTGSDRQDVKESGKITTVRGKGRIKTRVYAASQTWTADGEVVVKSDGAGSGLGKGVFFPLASGDVANGDYLAMGRVVTPPGTDGEWLVIDLYADPRPVTKSE